MHREICWPGQYLTHARSHITRAVAAIRQLFRPYWGSSAWHGSVNRKIVMYHAGLVYVCPLLYIPPTKIKPFKIACFFPNADNKTDLVTVFDAVLTSKQMCERLHCLYENLMSNNFRKTALLKKISIANWSYKAKDCPKKFGGVPVLKFPRGLL